MDVTTTGIIRDKNGQLVAWWDVNRATPEDIAAIKRQAETEEITDGYTLPQLKRLLADVVQKHTITSVLGVYSRVVERMAEEMAQDLFRDPVFRTEMQRLVRAACEQALNELTHEASSDSSAGQAAPP